MPPGAKDKFREINEADEVPGDPEKRKKYDGYGEHRKHADEFEKTKATLFSYFFSLSYPVFNLKSLSLQT